MGKSYLQQEHRIFTRYIIEGLATLVIKGSLKTPVVLIDLCPRGAGIYCNQFFEVGEEIEIVMNYFFGKVINKKAKVVWCVEVDKGSSWRMGLDFGLDNLLQLDNVN